MTVTEGMGVCADAALPWEASGADAEVLELLVCRDWFMPPDVALTEESMVRVLREWPEVGYWFRWYGRPFPEYEAIVARNRRLSRLPMPVLRLLRRLAGSR